ncbi:MAG: D-inositol-3-phosphate glycosyltransferase [Chlamydiales bacterium]|nr:D-inositol-3-phosphate glycosyltransferase [Chlamydiales bacterium]MCH9619611.1 D-inositol-3-phosphate glycosyltransferase [Chlamydiales bacterium]MCH9623217.1 D-inositol-3-phosphate glycosyltransferase [Chlamydiales bacterium]
MKIAVVHEWLTLCAGAEKVLSQILSLYPNADLFSVIDFFKEEERDQLLQKRAQTTFIQKLPFAKKLYPYYLPLMPLAIEQLDLRQYDLVLSSNHAVAKGVITAPDQLHICYCNTPLRYASELQHDYLSTLKGVKKWMAMQMLHKLRLWDLKAAQGVDYFIGNSNFIARRILKTYRREAAVIYPGVDLDPFPLCTEKKDYYITASRLVPYKKVDLIVKTFAKMGDKQLVVIGEGPEKKRIEKLCTSNIQLLGRVETAEMAKLIGGARGFIFAANEDFGIAPVEAQACGTPVIAFGKGGARETIDPMTGCFFEEQTEVSLKQAIDLFERKRHLFSPEACRQNSEKFSVERFQREFSTFVSTKMEEFYESMHSSRGERNEALALFANEFS